MGKKLVLATRKSPLALAQAELVAAYLRGKTGAECEFLKVVTTGDRQAE
ncbi:MAG TPA: hydroxymethylbilane synthase, partial [Planctomycetota bacterium]|nr:hydroxymethylbilane synthase [Planctomycetota bacterium]